MPSTVLLNATGLNTSPNQLMAREGSLQVAENVIIRRENVLEPRRGFTVYNQNTLTNSSKQLLQYKNRVISHDGANLFFEDGNGTFNKIDTPIYFSEYIDTDSTYVSNRIKSIEQNGNLYFTTSEGIQKIALEDESQYSSVNNETIYKSGVVKAIEPIVNLDYSYRNLTGILPRDSVCSYRLVWGYKDVNNNLVLGAPSDRIDIFNPMLFNLSKDFLAVLNVMSEIETTTNSPLNNSLIDYTQYKINRYSNGSDIYNTAISYITNLDKAINYNITSLKYTAKDNVVTLHANVNLLHYLTLGDYVNISDSTETTLNGDYIVTVDSNNNYILNQYDLKNKTTLVSGNTGFRTITAATNVAFPGNLNCKTFTQLVPEIENLSLMNGVHDSLQELSDFIEQFIIKLQSKMTLYYVTLLVDIANLGLTYTNSPTLDIVIPDELTKLSFNNNPYFLQIYRTNTAKVLGTATIYDIYPVDDMYLCAEIFPTESQYNSRKIKFFDEVTISQLGANLYTNANSGEGIVNSNYQAPKAEDINVFKGYTFVANTKSKANTTMSMIAVQPLHDYYKNNSDKLPKLSIGGQTYTFQRGIQQITEIECPTSNIDNQLEDVIITFDCGNDKIIKFKFKTNQIIKTTALDTVGPYDSTKIYLLTQEQTISSVVYQPFKYYKRDTTLNKWVQTDPENPYSSNLNEYIIRVLPTETKTSISNKLIRAISIVTSELETSIYEPTYGKVIIKHVKEGSYPVATCTKNNVTSTLFTITYIAGKGEDEEKLLTTDKDADKVVLLSTDISPANSIDLTIKSIIKVVNRNPFSPVYAYMIYGNNSLLPSIYFQAKTYITSFSISLDWTGLTIDGQIEKSFVPSLNTPIVGKQEVNRNTIWYSKFQQPESFPLINYIQIGAKDKKILRIHPLRDSLFIFKEDGIYRLSGDVAPFNVTLFDSNTDIAAPDTITSVNNLLFGWSTQGICVLSESTVEIVSRMIDNIIIPISALKTADFYRNAFAVGYESDNSYTAFYNNIGYRYSTTTNTWTNVLLNVNAGILKNNEDKLYFSSKQENNFILKERKSFNRYDYADRHYDINLTIDSFLPLNTLFLGAEFKSVFDIGDTITQTQEVSNFQFNSLVDNVAIDLLKDYDSFKITTNGDIRTHIDVFILQLKTDITGFDVTTSTSLTTYYNNLIDEIKDHLGSTYQYAQKVTLEYVTKQIKLSAKSVVLDFPSTDITGLQIGPATIYKGIKCKFIYSPVTNGDPLSLKHIRQATVMLDSNNVYQTTVSFASDLMPEFVPVTFELAGSGIFGNNQFGTNNFGGVSNSAPLRTFLPRNVQRCRYLTPKFEHSCAFEKWSYYGMTLFGEMTSEKAYR